MVRVPLYTPVAAVLVVLAAAGCNRGDTPDAKGDVTMKGTVHESQIGDGTQCWNFKSESGKDYELQPAQVPHELLVDGQAVTILAKPRKGGGSFCKVGVIVDVITVNPAST